MDIDDLRRRIDEIDEKILTLLNERYEHVKEIGHWKTKRDHAIYVPEREKKVLTRLEKLNTGPLTPKALRAIYREIMSGALALESAFVVACPGNECALAKLATLEKFGRNVKCASNKTIKQVFDDVIAKRAAYGVVPVEHSKEGVLNETLDLLRESPLRICSEIYANSQSEAEGGIEDVTRFIVLGRQNPKPTGDDKTSICLSLGNRAGSLCEAFIPFKERNIQITMLESRPSRDKEWEYLFFMDFTGHADVEPVKGAIEELRNAALDLRLLGSYPRADDVI